MLKKMLLCCLGLALVLAACGKASDAVTETTATTTTVITETSTEPQNETTAETETQTTVETASDEPITVPQDTAGVIAYFNAALAQTPMRRTSYRRTMTKITANAAFNIINEQNLQDDPAVEVYGNVYLPHPSPSDLVPLKAEWVKSAASRVEGGVATLTIVMAEYPVGSVADPVPGTLGYVGTVDKPTAEKLVEDAAMALAGGVLQRVSGVDSEFGLSAGKYVAAVDTTTGKLVSVRFTGTESAAGKATCVTKLIPLPVPATVTLRGDADAQYSPS